MNLKKMLREFKEFLSQGELVLIAIGLVMALYVKAIVDDIIQGVINPIVAAIFGKPNYATIGFDVGKARISIGLVLDGIINFVVVGFILFLLLKAYNKMKTTMVTPGQAVAPGPTEIELLTEIRDSLRNR